MIGKSVEKEAWVFVNESWHNRKEEIRNVRVEEKKAELPALRTSTD